MARSLSLIAALALGALAAGGPALAAVPIDDPDADLSKAVPARLVLGFKAGFGGSLWTEPDDTVLRNVDDADPTFSLPIFDETRGGFVFDAGFFAEGIFFDNLGLEVGLHFVQHRLIETVDWEYTTSVNGQITSRSEAESDEELQWTALHVPILIKAIIPSGNTRISLGIGPEFAFGSWAKTKFNIVESSTDGVPDDDPQLGGNRAALQTIRAKLEDSVYLKVAFGIEIVAGDFIIPIDIHWAYNFSQEADYQDRVGIDRLPLDGGPVTLDNHPTTLDLHTRDSMYGGLRIGLAYQFD